jgi:orotate phosphoribosyltransferase
LISVPGITATCGWIWMVCSCSRTGSGPTSSALPTGTAVRASCQELRDAGAAPVAVAALLAIGRASTVVTGTLGLPFHAATTMPSQVWPAGDCPLCQSGTPLDQPAS